jgi:amino acid adenylation domain-containing protein
VIKDTLSVPELISELSRNYGHSIALSYGEQQLSYRELDSRSSRFAGFLLELGAVSGGTVAICMERSPDWIVAALGILRTGISYVPLDPAWPESRLRFAIEESGSVFLVARAGLLDRLRFKTRGIDPSRDARSISSAPGLAPRSIDPDSLAYVIYTSGSTGVPKGVEITHGNLSHLVRWHLEAFKVTRQDRTSHLAGLGFDAAVWEIWPTLCAGATLCLATEACRSSPKLIQNWMIRERITIGFVPTVHATALMTMEWPEATSLRLLLTGGDVLQKGPAAKLPFDIVNNYGPTECTVVATSTVLKDGLATTPSIGRAIPGTSVYLLNDERKQVPVGSVGEIYIGGSGVGRGYRNLPELTARSFLPDPFAGARGSRIYRTGDLGVQRPDGEIEFRGRLDRQTKIRGQRVELDEIGSTLSRHPSIDFATAIASISEAGVNQLIAYVLPKENACPPTSIELQKYLLSRLPDYMVPAVFVRLSVLPISPSGKVDLALLPPLKDAQLLKGKVTRAPASPIEEKLLGLVRQLLENDTVSAEDSFFLAGGHSLLAMQLLLRLRETFGVDLTLRQLFESPTVERLAASVEEILRNERIVSIWGDLLATKQVGLDDNFFDLGGSPSLIAALQQRMRTEFGKYVPMADLCRNQTVRQQAELVRNCEKWKPHLPPGVFAIKPTGNRNPIFWVHYAGLELARELGDEQPFFSVMLSSEDFVSLGENPTLQAIATCLLGKILSTQPDGPYVIGGFCLGGTLAYEIASQLRDAGHGVSLLVMLDTPSPPYVAACDSILQKARYAKYLVKRATRLGARTSLVYLRQHLHQFVVRMAGEKPARTELSIAQEMSEAAMFGYLPRKYDGRVLLLLAAEKPPHLDFHSGWQAFVRGKLHLQYLDAHHRDLAKTKNMRTIAAAIAACLEFEPEDKTESLPLEMPATGWCWP